MLEVEKFTGSIDLFSLFESGDSRTRCSREKPLEKPVWTQDICNKISEKAVERRKERDPGAVPDLGELIAGSQAVKTE
jgi:hypothetical protein